MEETLGKRIASHRKRLGLTQDALAERLGVTAQAVSKWENDQSCPDITMLPKLSRVFGITTDEMLGLKTEEAHTGQVIEKAEAWDTDEDHPGFEVRLNTGKTGSLGLGLWILLTACLMLVHPLWQTEPVSLWDLLWPSGLLVFGLFGLYPKFSVLRLGCGLLGGYYLLSNLGIISHFLTKTYLLPLFLLLFGLSLLVDALQKPKGKFHIGIPHNIVRRNSCDLEKDRFSCTTSFGEDTYPIQLSNLSGGEADLSFGAMTIDLRDCEQVSPGCTIDLNASFGELELLVPRRFRMVPDSSTAFAVVNVEGTPSDTVLGTIHVNCSVSFGEISLRYI